MRMVVLIRPSFPTCLVALALLAGCWGSGEAESPPAASPFEFASYSLIVLLDPTVDVRPLGRCDDEQGAAKAPTPEKRRPTAVIRRLMDSLDWERVPPQFELVVYGSQGGLPVEYLRERISIDVTKVEGAVAVERKVRARFEGAVTAAFKASHESCQPCELESCLVWMADLALQRGIGCSDPSRQCSVLIVSDLVEACPTTENFSRGKTASLRPVAEDLPLDVDSQPDCVYIWQRVGPDRDLTREKQLRDAWIEFFETLGTGAIQAKQIAPRDLFLCR